MTTTFRLAANELDQTFLDRVKAMFREKQVAIVVYEENETSAHSANMLPQGMPWEQMKRYAGSLPDDAGAEILAAIEEDCENIDADKW